MSNLFTFIGVFVVALPLLIGIALLGTMWRAWWLYPAWGWYLVPLGVPAVSFWHFTALMILVAVLTAHVETKKDERKTEWASYVVVFLWPIVAWAILRWLR
jgi:hypothetical protein